MTDIQIVRALIGDETASQLSDSDIAVFCTLALTPQYASVAFVSNPYSSGNSGSISEYFFAASMAMNAIASKVAANLQEVRIGDFTDSSGKNKVTALRAAADAYQKLYYETPAWAVIESNESDLNALTTIRNYVLRTNP